VGESESESEPEQDMDEGHKERKWRVLEVFK
jgi:hypothetical protein